MHKNEIEIAKNELALVDDLFAKGRYKDILQLFNRVLPIFHSHQLWEDYIELLIETASITGYLNQYEKSVSSLNQAIEIGKIQLPTPHLLQAKAYYVLAVSKWRQNDFKESLLNHQKALGIKQNLPETTQEDCLDNYLQIGICYGKISRHNEALKYILKSLNICQEIYHEYNNHYVLIYNEIGWNHLSKGDYTKALYYYRKTLDIQQQIVGRNHPKTLEIFSALGVIYSRQGDLIEALHHYKESLSIAQYLRQQDATYHRIFWIIANAHHNIGSCYLKKEALEQALSHHQKALSQWLEICKSNDPILAISYDKHALCFEKQGDHIKALAYYEKALNIRLEVFGEQHPTTARSYLNIGLLKPLEEQLNYFEKALHTRQELFGGKHPDIGATYEQIGKWHMAHLQWEKALNFLHQGVCSLYEDWEANSLAIEAIPPFEKMSDGAILLQLLQAKSQCFQALHAISQQATYQKAANAHMVAACDLIDHIRLSYKAEGSKLFLSKMTRKIYGETINTLLEGNLSENKFSLAHTTFQVAEKSRAAVLLGNMKDFDAKIASNIPAELLEEEQQLKLELSYLNQRIQQAAFKQTDEETIQNWQSQYFQFKQKYDALTEQFEKDFPEYFQLKYNTASIDVTILQSSLTPQSAMIEYFVDEAHLYIFWVTQTQFEVVRVEETKSLEKMVRQFIRTLNSGSQRRFAKAASQLYAWLLQPIVHLLEGEKTIQHLIFIPDDCLFMLPFDALLQPHSQRYLIEDYQVSHHYSASLWYLIRQKQQQNNTSKKDSFLGFAPIVFGKQSLKSGDVLPPKSTSGYTLDSQSKRRIVLKSGDSLEEMEALEESEVEVQKVFQLFEDKHLKAKAFFYESANKTNLLKQVEGYKYILISTHGFVNKEVPSLSGLLLAKSPMNTVEEGVDIGGKMDIENANKLFLSETYHLPLSADLVVLSSCESGIGEVLKGEGMIALNRGFLHAGASNVLYSLIKVPQDATSELVQIFFQEILENGKSYPEALQLAKCQLIAQKYELRDWAGFALLGG